MKNKRIIGNMIGVLIIIILWIILSVKINIFPSLLQIIYQFSTILVKNSVYLAVFYTILRALIAFLITLLISIITANLAYKFSLFNNIIHPILSFFRSIPTISLILVVILITKLELITYFIIFIISLPILHESIYNSLRNINKELLMINKMDNSNKLMNYFYFYLPMSYNGIINGIMQTFGISIKTQIMSEVLTGSTKIKGVGVLLNYYKTNLELENLFAITFIIILFVYLIELLIKRLLNNTINLT